MDAKEISLFYCLIFLKTAASQYYGNIQYQNAPRAFYETSDYEGDPQGYEGDFRGYERFSTRMQPYSHKDKQQCECSCNECTYNVEPCCVSVCNYCSVNSNTGKSNVNQPNSVVYMPYPVPLVIPDIFKNNGSDDATTTEKSTTSTTASTTTKTTEAPPATYDSVALGAKTLGRRKLKTLNPISERKIRPAWVPKYGIVPLPDDVAVKLMNQLTDERALKGRRL